MAEPAAALVDPYQPLLRWEEMTDYKDGEAVLSRNAGRQVFGYRTAGVWYELLDGDETPLSSYQPVEWTYLTREMQLQYMML